MNTPATTDDRSGNGGDAAGPGIFLSFFYRLRSHGLKVTPKQWLTLIEALSKGLHGSSLAGFYSLARGILVKDESELDDFDVCFAAHFEGVDAQAAVIEDEVWKWLENASTGSSRPTPPPATGSSWPTR